MVKTPAGRLSKRGWWLVSGAAVLVVVIVAVAVALGGNRQGAVPAQTPNPLPTVPVGSAPAPSTPATPPTSAAASTPGVSPSATPTRAVQREAYCRAFAQIRTGSVSTGSDENGVDLDELADRFSSLIASYSRASKAAPSSLDRQYAVVLAYLRDMRKAVVSRDLDGIKLMIKNLELLNRAMDAIQAESEEICR